MDFTHMNYWGVLVAAVASFAFGAAYYMALGKPWMAATGKTAEELAPARAPATFVTTFLAQLIMAGVLSGVLAGLSGGLAVGHAVPAALFLWIGFLLMPLFVNHSYQRMARALTVIDGGHWLGVVVVQAVVLGLFGPGGEMTAAS